MKLGINGTGFVRKTWLPLSLLALFAAPAMAQIDTFPAWNGTSFISSFGVTNTATYGQTITVPSGASPLQSFSFQIGNCTANVTARGEVYAWDGSKATGAALYESAPITVNSSAAFQVVTFTPGGLSLAAGQYVLFATTSRDQSGAPASACRWGALTNNTTIPGGQFVFENNGPDPTQWTSNTWSVIAEDLAIQVIGLTPPVVASVPADSPTSLLIGFAALIGIAMFWLARRRRSHAV